MEQREHCEDFFVGWGCEGEDLEGFSDDVTMCDLHGFGEARRAGAEGEEGADLVVGFAWGNLEGRNLGGGAVGLALGDEGLDAGVTREGAFEEENPRLGDTSCGSGLGGDGDGGVRGGEILCFSGLKGVGHFLDIIGW